MNLSRLKKHVDDDDRLTPEEESLIIQARKENVWIPLEDIKAHFRVLDTMTEYDKV